MSEKSEKSEKMLRAKVTYNLNQMLGGLAFPSDLTAYRDAVDELITFLDAKCERAFEAGRLEGVLQQHFAEKSMPRTDMTYADWNKEQG
jgi:hypothetical protein